MSERVDLCHSVMYTPFFECPLFLFADLQINVVVGRCRTLSFDLGILCLSGFLAFKGRSYSLACHRLKGVSPDYVVMSVRVIRPYPAPLCHSL
jgi:hypothetical protein